MYHLILLLSFLSLILAAPLDKRGAAFLGTGQLIINDQTGQAIGCLINTGEFTADLSGCAVFTGNKTIVYEEPPYENHGKAYRTFTTELGYCGAPVVGPYPAVSPIVCNATMDPLVESYWLIATGQNAHLGVSLLQYGKVSGTTLYQTLDGEVPGAGAKIRVTPVYGNNSNKGTKYVIVWKAV